MPWWSPPWSASAPCYTGWLCQEPSLCLPLLLLASWLSRNLQTLPKKNKSSASPTWAEFSLWSAANPNAINIHPLPSVVYLVGWRIRSSRMFWVVPGTPSGRTVCFFPGALWTRSPAWWTPRRASSTGSARGRRKCCPRHHGGSKSWSFHVINAVRFTFHPHFN